MSLPVLPGPSDIARCFGSEEERDTCLCGQEGISIW